MIASIVSLLVISAEAQKLEAKTQRPILNRQIITLTLPSTWQALGKTAQEGVRQASFASIENGVQTKALIVNFYEKSKISFSQATELVGNMLKRECFTEQLPLDIQLKNYKDEKAKPESPINWILYTCGSRKRSGWFLTIDADEKTVTQVSLEVPAYPISGELRDELMASIQKYLVWCISYDEDCQKAVSDSVKKFPNGLVAMLPTYLDDKVAKKP